MKLSDLAEYTQIPTDKELSVVDLENLITRLAVLRAQTSPAVLPKAPTAADADSRANVSVQSDPDITIAALASGGARLWLRHEGYGWMAVTFSPDKARVIRDYLVKWVRGAASMNLIDDQPAGGKLLQ
jgi:hypothetical protein